MISITVIFLAGCFLGWFFYHLGYASGFEVGKNDTLDQMAQRHERLRRFNGGYPE